MTRAAPVPQKTVTAPRPAGLAHGRVDPILRNPSQPAGNGPERLEELRQLHPSLPVMVLSCSELTGEQLSLVDAASARSPMDMQHALTILARLLPAKELCNA